MHMQQPSLAFVGTVAVTGATGVIGRHLVPALLAAGASVRVLSRQTTPPASPVTAVPGDLRDPASLATLVQGASAVVHLAGIAHTSLRTPAEEEAAAAINVDGTRALLRAATNAGIPHLLYFSSAHVYRGQQGLNLAEDSPKDTGTGYAAMKLQAERLLQAEAAPGQRITVLRPCLTYGPGVRFNLQQLMRAVQAGRYVHPGGADALRSFVSVDTVAAAVLHLLATRSCSMAGSTGSVIGSADKTAPAVTPVDTAPHNNTGFAASTGSTNGTGPAILTYNLADRQPQSLRTWVDRLAAHLQVRPPRTIPVQLLRIAAAVGTTARAAGIPSPLTSEALRKLTAPFTLNVDRLAATGFVWPATTDAVVAGMVANFQADLLEHPRVRP